MAQIYVTADGEKFMTISLRLPVDLKKDLDALAMSQGVSVSSILLEFVEGLTAANKTLIEAYRKLVAMPAILPQFVSVDNESQDDNDDEYEELDEDGDDEEETTL